MSLELAIAEFEALKPAFVLDDSKKTRKMAVDAIQRVVKAINETADNIKSSQQHVSTLEFCWPGITHFENIEGSIKYQKLMNLLKKQGFENSCKKTGDYTIAVYDSEGDLSLTITKSEKLDLQKVHNKLKAQIPILKPSNYEFRHEDVNNADMCGVPTFYDASILRNKSTIKRQIALAKHNFGYVALQEDIKKLNELKAKINNPEISKTVKKEEALRFAGNYRIGNFSLKEMRQKNFPSYVAGLIGRAIDEQAKENEEKFDIGERNNLCLYLIKCVGGMAFYQDRKMMWQNITSSNWTPESLDKVITNLRDLAPVFESI